MQGRFSHVMRALFLVLQIVAGIALFGMIGATIADILCRHFLGFSVGGVVEGVEFLFVWLVFLGFAIAFFTGAHVCVDIIDMALSPRARRALQFVNSLVAIAVLGVLTWLSWGELLDKYDWGDRTIDLKIPLTWYWGAVVLGFALSVLAVVVSVFAKPAGDRP